AASSSLNVRATSPAGTVTGEICSGATTLSVYVCDATCVPSDTCTLNVKSPVAVGVPEIRPPEPSCKPPGRPPDCSDHVCVPPPCALSWKLYGVPTVVAAGASAVWTMLKGVAGAPPPTTVSVNSRCASAGRHQSALGGFWSLRSTQKE